VQAKLYNVYLTGIRNACDTRYWKSDVKSSLILGSQIVECTDPEKKAGTSPETLVAIQKPKVCHDWKICLFNIHIMHLSCSLP
jgi:hypothetical protein